MIKKGLSMGQMAEDYSPGGRLAFEPDEESQNKKKTLKYHSKLVGVTFEGRQDVIKMLKGDEPLRVRREADNEYDSKAVAVDAEIAETWQPIGYIAKDKNKDISAALDAGNEVEIAIASITGGGTKSFGVNIALEYEKVSKVNSEATTQNEAKLNYTQSQLEGLPHDSNVLAQIKALLGIKEERTKYTSRILGKSVDVTVTNGHVSLPGFVSGSKFPSKFFAEFPRERILDATVKKFFEEKDWERVKVDIEEMWATSGLASTSFGTGVHAAMENYDKYHKLGDKIKSVKKFKTKPDEVGPNKSLSKNPFLKKIVEDFHELYGGDYVRFSEQFIWDLGEQLCGSIDRLKVIDAKKKIVRIQDFKTDTNIHEKKAQNPDSPYKKIIPETQLGYHQLQLSFYAYILKKYGYTTEGLDVYWLNPNKLVKGENSWEEFQLEVIDIEEGLIW